MVQEVQTKHVEVKDELKQVPREIESGESVSHLNSLVQQYSTAFNDALTGDEEGSSLADDLHTLMNEFWVAMQ